MHSPENIMRDQLSFQKNHLDSTYPYHKQNFKCTGGNKKIHFHGKVLSALVETSLLAFSRRSKHNDAIKV